MSYPDLTGVGTYDWSQYGAYYSYNATETSSHNVANELVYSYLDSSNTTHTYPEHDIVVNTSTNTWSDHGSGDPSPSGFNIDSNGDIELKASNIVRFRFTPPAPSTWGAWGGSFYNVTSSEFSYKVFHTSAFTSSQTYELHSTTLTPTFISDLVVGAASGSINSRTHTWGTPDVVEIRDAYGTVGAQLTLSYAAPPTTTPPTTTPPASTTTTQKKVFCNFW